MHESFRGVRSFADFAAVPLPATLSAIGYNDKVRFWNILVGMRGTPLDYYYGTPSHIVQLSLPDLNVSRGSLAGSISKLTKLLRFVTQNRSARFSAQYIAATSYNTDALLNGLDVARIRVNQNMVEELLNVFNPLSPALTRGRGRTNPNNPSPATRTRALSRSRAQRARDAATQIRAGEPSPIQPDPAAGLVMSSDGRMIGPDGTCYCEQCIANRERDARALEARNRQEVIERRFAESLQGLLAGFEPWAGINPNVFHMLMMEAASPG